MKINALNTISGVVAPVNESDLAHPFFSKFLVEVPEGTKSYAPEKYVSKTADEWRADHRKSEKVEPEASRDAPDNKNVGK